MPTRAASYFDNHEPPYLLVRLQKAIDDPGTERRYMTGAIHTYFDTALQPYPRSKEEIRLCTASFYNKVIDLIRRRALEDEINPLTQFVTKRVKEMKDFQANERTTWKANESTRPHWERSTPVAKVTVTRKHTILPIREELPRELVNNIAKFAVDAFRGRVIINAFNNSKFSHTGTRSWRLCLNDPNTKMGSIRSPSWDEKGHPIGIFHGATSALEVNGSHEVRDAFFQMKLGFYKFEAVYDFLQPYVVIHPEGDHSLTSRAQLTKNFAVIRSNDFVYGDAGLLQLQFQTFKLLLDAHNKDTLPFIYSANLHNTKKKKFLGCAHLDRRVRAVFLILDLESWHDHSPRHPPLAGFTMNAPNEDEDEDQLPVDEADADEFAAAVDVWKLQDQTTNPPIQRVKISDPNVDDAKYSFYWELDFVNRPDIMGEISRIMVTPEERRTVMTAAMSLEVCQTEEHEFEWQYGGSRAWAHDWVEGAGDAGEGYGAQDLGDTGSDLVNDESGDEVAAGGAGAEDRGMTDVTDDEDGVEEDAGPESRGGDEQEGSSGSSILETA